MSMWNGQPLFQEFLSLPSYQSFANVTQLSRDAFLINEEGEWILKFQSTSVL